MRAQSTTRCRTRQALLGVAIYGSVAAVGVRTSHDPEFLTYDATERLVRLTVTAGYNETNSGFNINGGSRGSHRITVPVGWRVRVSFANRDVIPHSVALVRDTGRLPVRVDKPAFPFAATMGINRGLPPDATDDFTFVPTVAGAYLLACGVPGHTAVGSYLRFVVSLDADVPTYETHLPVIDLAGRD